MIPAWLWCAQAVELKSVDVDFVFATIFVRVVHLKFPFWKAVFISFGTEVVFGFSNRHCFSHSVTSNDLCSTEIIGFCLLEEYS